MKLYLTKTDNGSFIPVYNSDKEIADKIKPGQVVEVSVKKNRNYQFLKKYWALIRFTLFHLPEDLSDKYKTKELLHQEIKLQCGIYEKHITLGGKEIIKVGSVSFDTMNAEEFDGFYSQALDLVCKFLLPGLSSKDVESEILEFM